MVWIPDPWSGSLIAPVICIQKLGAIKKELVNEALVFTLGCMTDDDSSECRHVTARGRVQGVGFRESCVQYARAHGISGWVRNRADSSVEAVLHGRPADVAGMCDWLRHGVPGARVDALEIDSMAAPVEPFQGFERRPSV